MKIKSNFKDIFNDTQKEALINEIKGNLFEFLVAHNCAKCLNIEAQFLKSIDFEMKTMLASYEKWLKVHDRDLASSLVRLSKHTSDDLITYLENKNKDLTNMISNIYLIGKIAKQASSLKLYEADFIFVWEGGKKEQLVSLKLSKKNAYVSTKSAGVKSFIANYFESFSDALEKQQILNCIVDECFMEMGTALYSRRGLEFSGRFDSQWIWTELPGELEKEDHDDLNLMYRKLSENLYLLLTQFYKQSPLIFAKCLLPLLGFGQKDLLQVTCYYFEKQNYNFHKTTIFGLNDEDLGIEFLPFNPNTSSFEIKVDKFLLQIRIKPMNKFTTASYKVNCSMRPHEN